MAPDHDKSLGMVDEQCPAQLGFVWFAVCGKMHVALGSWCRVKDLNNRSVTFIVTAVGYRC